MTQTLILRGIPAEQIDALELKYKQMGSKTEKAKQDDGTYTLRITLETPVEA